MRERVARLVARCAWVLGSPVRALLIGLIRLYRVSLACLFGGQCRFYPSCSVYAEEAVRRQGALRGTALAAWRVLRCSPFSAGGPDPVPRRGAQALYDDVIQREEAAG